MTDYIELVKALRETATFTKFDDLLSKREQKLESLAFDAASAIEALQAEVLKLEERTKAQQGRLEDYMEKQLYIDHYGDKWMTSAKDVPTAAYNHGYMDGKNEAEQALEPKQRKLGRWEKAKPKGVVVYSDGYAECSSCHEVIWLGWGMNFCPHCGVQNRIIDPDDMAKMEVQDGE